VIEPTLAEGLPAGADVAIALTEAVDERDESMLRLLRSLGCWTLLSVLVGIAVGRAIRRSRRDERREWPHG
jgi:hypothetical protein